MKRFALLALAGLLAAPAFGASVSIYGQIDIGGLPEPPILVNREPVIIERVSVRREPVYLHVPPGHAKHWGKHCAKYNACGRPVYFVQEDWYERVYVPRHGPGGGPEGKGPRGKGPKHGDDHGGGKGHGHGHGKGH